NSPWIDLAGSRSIDGHSGKPPTAVTQEIKNLIQIPRGMTQRAHTVRGEDKDARLIASQRNHFSDLAIDGAVSLPNGIGQSLWLVLAVERVRRVHVAPKVMS